jgi:AraC-like DNA-binding protein
MLHYVEIPPSLPLAPYIHAYRILYGTVSGEKPSHAPYFPDGLSEISLNYGEVTKYSLNFSANSQFDDPQGWIAGPTMTTRVILLHGEIDIFNISLTPQGASPLLNLPTAALADARLPLDTLWKPEFIQALLDLAALPPLQRIALLEPLLLRYIDARPAEPLMQRVIATFDNSKGQPSVQTLLHTLPLSERSLDRLFQRHLGLSPKRYLRLIRFQYMLHLLRTYPEERWVQLALDAGYYDQAHLDHELTTLTGFSTRRLLQTATFGGLLQDNIA